MEKKLLIAVDASLHSQYAVSYTQSLDPTGKNIQCTLFNVQPAISSFLMEEAKTSGKANAELKKVIQKNAAEAHRFLSEYKEKMTRNGWEAGHIDMVSHPKMQGAAKDILDYAQKGLFDAIVAGRRGVTRAQELFTGSVTTNLLEHSRLTPVWVVDKSIAIHRILAAVDGSKSAFRAVEHLSLILSNLANVHVTLFYVNVKPSLGMDFIPEEAGDFQKILATAGKHHIDIFFTAAKERFATDGLSESQVETKIGPAALQVGKAIVNEVKKDGYDTVVVGRTGEENRFFMGSVSRYVLRKLSDCAVWLVP